MRPAPYGAFKRFCLWQKPCRRANSFRPRISICQGPQKSLLFWARAPAARAGVAGAGAVGVNCYGFHSFLLGRGWILTVFAKKKEGSALQGGFLSDRSERHIAPSRPAGRNSTYCPLNSFCFRCSYSALSISPASFRPRSCSSRASTSRAVEGIWSWVSCLLRTVFFSGALF